ncbi:response regulator transcription factor [Nocardioides sp. CN2-186]|uniref:response regulator transcription factor n=1 Tax=Nocardioides tweenelious TaxID=3156607 RepID=UPI0032B3FB89
MESGDLTLRRAVVIEDDADIAALLETALTSQGFEVTVASDGRSGVEQVIATDPDLVTLDVGLPVFDGLEVCRRIRPLTDAYVIMVTAMAEEIDRLIGLEAGADDYLAKPVSIRELKARVNAMFRRPRQLATSYAGGATQPETPPHLHAVHDPAPSPRGTLHHGDLSVDLEAHRVLCGDRRVDLTPTEFRLLVTLMRAPSRVWSRSVLLQEVWGSGWEETHLVEVHMGNLRRKLGDRRGEARFVENVRGVGYRMLDAS